LFQESIRSRTETENAKSGAESNPLLSQKDNKIKSGMDLEGNFIAKKVFRRNALTKFKRQSTNCKRNFTVGGSNPATTRILGTALF
jgi:hypothetical protein